PAPLLAFEGRRSVTGLSLGIDLHALAHVGGEPAERLGPARGRDRAGERGQPPVAGHSEDGAQHQPEQPPDHGDASSRWPLRVARRQPGAAGRGSALSAGAGGRAAAGRTAGGRDPRCAPADRRLHSALFTPYAIAATLAAGEPALAAITRASGASAVIRPVSSTMLAVTSSMLAVIASVLTSCSLARSMVSPARSMSDSWRSRRLATASVVCDMSRAALAITYTAAHTPTTQNAAATITATQTAFSMAAPHERLSPALARPYRVPRGAEGPRREGAGSGLTGVAGARQ